MNNTQSLLKANQNKNQKLIYRGQTYYVNDKPVMSSSESPAFFTYRGQTYIKTSSSVCLNPKNTAKLIYRGQTYNRTLLTPEINLSKTPQKTSSCQEIMI